MTNKVNQKIQLLEENLKKLNRLKELNKEEFIRLGSENPYACLRV